jgi:hypothetical protein
VSPGDAAGTADEAGRRVLEALEQYLGITQVLWGLLAPGDAARSPADHARSLEEAFNRLQEQAREAWAGAFAGTGSGSPTAGAGWPGTGGTPFENAWLQAATQFEWPALGLTRERQERSQDLARAGQAFAQAQLRMTLLWGQVIREALQGLAERVASTLAEGKSIPSPRALYDLWVDCGEAAFLRHAHSGEFGRAQGALTNAASSLRIEQRRLVEGWARELDLPTRELNSVHVRLKELRAEVRELRRELAAAAAAQTPSTQVRRRAAKPPADPSTVTGAGSAARKVPRRAKRSARK